MSLIEANLNIVIVNFNGTTDTIKCLESILSSISDFSVSIFVVDNSTNYKEYKLLLDWWNSDLRINLSNYKKAKNFSIGTYIEEEFKNKPVANFSLIKADRNNGFAAANNIVLNNSQVERNAWFWLLNNDTIIDVNALLKLFNFFEQEKNKNVGIIGTSLYYFHDTLTLQGVGGSYNKWSGTTKHVAEGIDEQELMLNFDNFKDKIDYIIGASLLLSGELISDIGVLEESNFLYFEEMDYFERAKIKKWQFELLADVKVFHKEGASINKVNGNEKSELAEVCNLNSRIVFAKKYYPNFLLSIYLYSLLTIGKRIMKFKFQRAFLLLKIMLFKGMFKTYIDNLK